MPHKGETKLRQSHQQFILSMRGLGYRVKLDTGNRETPYVPGKNGRLEWHSWNNEVVALYTDGRGTMGKLIRHPLCTVWQRGDSEARVLVGRKDVPEVAEIVKPYKRRKVSVEARAQLMEMSRRSLEARGNRQRLEVGV